MADGIYSYPTDPLVARNTFRGRVWQATSPSISFTDARPRLPQPVLPQHAGWVEMYWRAWEIAWSNLRRPRANSGLVADYVDCAADDHIFMWDTAFMMLFGLYGRRGFPFIGSLDNFYARQHQDGFICREINTNDGHDYFERYDPNSTGPNILAWVEWQYYRATGDNSRIGDVFWPLMALHRWMRAHRTWRDGLYWATGMSSGMNNQERIPDSRFHHRHWCWIDATLQAALNCAILEQMAELLGETEGSRDLAEERLQLQQNINRRMWHAEHAFYVDIGPDGQHGDSKSLAAFWALLVPDLLTPERLVPFLQHLRHREVFSKPHPLPSLSADSIGYQPDGPQWLGGVWSPLNYMVLRGLRRVGHASLAHDIGVKHLRQVEQVFARTDTFWDHYAPEEAAPGTNARSGFVGWTGLTPISILIEFVMGIHVEWPLRRVTWEQRLPVSQPYGIRHYPLGEEGWLDLVGDEAKVTVTTTVPFTLVVSNKTGKLQVVVDSGTTEIPLS